MIGLMPYFSPGKQVFQGEERYDDKPYDFGDEIIRETWHVGFHSHDKEIIKPVIRSTLWKSQSQQRPKENRRLCPHAVLQEMEERCASYKKNAHFPAAPVEIISRKRQEKTEYESMSDKPSAGNRIRKEHPSNELVNNIRQERTEGDIPVVYPATDFRDKTLEDEKDSNCDAQVTEKEHGRFYNLY